MPPNTAINFAYLLPKLPQNGLGARVAPIPWVLSGRPSCYYCVTGVSISYAPFVDRAGFPVKLVDGKKVPADQAYSKNQAEAAKQKAEEAMRAARAGEMVQDTNIREKLRVKEELDELLVETHNGIMRPLVKAWGIRYENGIAVDSQPMLIEEDITSATWREVSDEPITLKSLKKLHLTKQKPRIA